MFGFFRNWCRDDPAQDAEEYFASIEDHRDHIGWCDCCQDHIYGDAMAYGQYGDKFYQIETKMIHESCLDNWLDEQPRMVLIFGYWIDYDDIDPSINQKWLDKQPTKVFIDGVWLDRQKAKRFMDTYYLQE